MTRVVINTDAETTLDSILTGTVKSVDYSLTLYQGAGAIGKKILATENGAGASTQEYASSSVNREEHSGVWNWTTQTSNFGTTDIFSVAYGNSLWVAGGATGQLRTENPAERTLKLTATVSSALLIGSEATAILEKTVVVA